MKFSLLAVAFIGLFLIALTLERAPPTVETLDDIATFFHDLDNDVTLASADGAEDFDRMPVAIDNN